MFYICFMLWDALADLVMVFCYLRYYKYVKIKTNMTDYYIPKLTHHYTFSNCCIIFDCMVAIGYDQVGIIITDSSSVVQTAKQGVNHACLCLHLSQPNHENWSRRQSLRGSLSLLVMSQPSLD